jgi:hypothetical protein
MMSTDTAAIAECLDGVRRDIDTHRTRLDSAVEAAKRAVMSADLLVDIAPQLIARLSSSGYTAGLTLREIGDFLNHLYRSCRAIAGMGEQAATWRTIAATADDVARHAAGADRRLSYAWSDRAGVAYLTIVPPGQAAAADRIAEIARATARTLDQAQRDGLVYLARAVGLVGVCLTLVTQAIRTLGIAGPFAAVYLCKTCQRELTYAKAQFVWRLNDHAATLDGQRSDAWPSPVAATWRDRTPSDNSPPAFR